MKRVSVLVLILAVGLSAPGATGQEFSIQSDETVVEDDRKILKGNVVIEFENVRFQADEVIEYLADGDPVRYEATGDPVVVEQKGGALKGLKQGRCEKLVYLVREKTLQLTNYELHLDNGSVQRGGSLKLAF